MTTATRHNRPRTRAEQDAYAKSFEAERPEVAKALREAMLAFRCASAGLAEAVSMVTGIPPCVTDEALRAAFQATCEAEPTDTPDEVLAKVVGAAFIVLVTAAANGSEPNTPPVLDPSNGASMRMAR